MLDIFHLPSSISRLLPPLQGQVAQHATTYPSSVFSFCFRTKLCEEAHLIFGGGVGKHLMFVEVKRNIWQICSENSPFQADKWVLKVRICAPAHLLHQVHLKQPRAGDAWLVARLDEIFHHPDKNRNIAQPRAGDAPFAQVVM